MKGTLVVGDVQGDAERLIGALAKYDPTAYATVFLGDFFQGGIPGRAGGYKAARLAMSRPNARSVLGNHEVFLLCVIELLHGVPVPEFPEPAHLGPSFGKMFDGTPGTFIKFWESRRGDWADCHSLEADSGLEEWIRNLPLVLLDPDGTLYQHCDSDSFLDAAPDIEGINAWGRELLAQPGGVFTLLRPISRRGAFDTEERTKAYLDALGATRVVHGHSPHGGDVPRVRWGGLELDYDGKFSRYWRSSSNDTPSGPVEASIGLLPPLADANSRA